MTEMVSQETGPGPHHHKDLSETSPVPGAGMLPRAFWDSSWNWPHGERGCDVGQSTQEPLLAAVSRSGRPAELEGRHQAPGSKQVERTSAAGLRLVRGPPERPRRGRGLTPPDVAPGYPRPGVREAAAARPGSSGRRAHHRANVCSPRILETRTHSPHPPATPGAAAHTHTRRCVWPLPAGCPPHFHGQKPACREPGHTRAQTLAHALPKLTRMPPVALAVHGSRTHSQAPTLREVHAEPRRLDTADVADPTRGARTGPAPPARTSHTGRLELGAPNAGPVSPHPLTVLTAPLTWPDP